MAVLHDRNRHLLYKTFDETSTTRTYRHALYLWQNLPQEVWHVHLNEEITLLINLTKMLSKYIKYMIRLKIIHEKLLKDRPFGIYEATMSHLYNIR